MDTTDEDELLDNLDDLIPRERFALAATVESTVLAAINHGMLVEDALRCLTNWWERRHPPNASNYGRANDKTLEALIYSIRFHAGGGS